MGRTIQGTHDHNPVMNTFAQNTPVQNPIEAPKRQTKSRAVSLLSNTSIDNRSNLIPLDNNNIVTPIHVDALKDALRGHPDPSFVLKLCSDLRFGARLGYDGPRNSKFSKNLKSAIDNPTIVSNNLAKELHLDTQLVLLLIHHLLIYKSHQLVLSLKSIRTNSVRFFTFPSQKRENQLIPLSRRTIFHCSI